MHVEAKTERTDTDHIFTPFDFILSLSLILFLSYAQKRGNGGNLLGPSHSGWRAEG